MKMKNIIIWSMILVLSFLAIFLLKPKMDPVASDREILFGRWSKFIVPLTADDLKGKKIELVSFFENDENQNEFISFRTLDLEKKEQTGYLKGIITRFDTEKKMIQIDLIESDGNAIDIKDWDSQIKVFYLHYSYHSSQGKTVLLLYLSRDGKGIRFKLGDFIKDKSR